MIKNNQSVPDLMLELADKQIAISKKISSTKVIWHISQYFSSRLLCMF